MSGPLIALTGSGWPLTVSASSSGIRLAAAPLAAIEIAHGRQRS